MTTEELEILGAWMARMETLLERIAYGIERIEQNTSATEAAAGDLVVKAGELFQAVDGIQAELGR